VAAGLRNGHIGDKSSFGTGKRERGAAIEGESNPAALSDRGMSRKKEVAERRKQQKA
jgi:hypothetical protein